MTLQQKQNDCHPVGAFFFLNILWRTEILLEKNEEYKRGWEILVERNEQVIQIGVQQKPKNVFPNSKNKLPAPAELCTLLIRALGNVLVLLL